MLSYQVKCCSGVQCLSSSGRHGKAVLRKKAYGFIGHNFCSVECAILWYGRVGGGGVGESSVGGVIAEEAEERLIQRPVVRPLELGGIFPVGLGALVDRGEVPEVGPGSSEMGGASEAAREEGVSRWMMEAEGLVGEGENILELGAEVQTDELDAQLGSMDQPGVEQSEEMDVRIRAASVIQGIAYDSR